MDLDGRLSSASAEWLLRRAGELRAARSKPGPARIAVVGEPNTGKTTLVNTLIGEPVLPATVTAHTPCVTVVEYARTRRLVSEDRGAVRSMLDWSSMNCSVGDARRLRVGLPLPALKGLRVLDTPGLGRGNSTEDRRILRACRAADLLVWCTPAMQAWKRSEQVLWLALPQSRRANGVLAVTFADAISPGDAKRLLARLQEEARSHFRDIILFPGSPLQPEPVGLEAGADPA